jgi:hypothetical protein
MAAITFFRGLTIESTRFDERGGIARLPLILPRGGNLFRHFILRHATTTYPREFLFSTECVFLEGESRGPQLKFTTIKKVKKQKKVKKGKKKEIYFTC